MGSTTHFNKYAFENSSQEATTQLSHLEAFLDPTTIASLEPGFGSARRCLELGPGRGSISHWMADRVAEDGEVVALDINPVHIPPHPKLRVVRQDIRDGLEVDGPFDVIHARLVLSHIVERHDIVTQLIELLAPGGWLVIGEFVRDPAQVILASQTADEKLYTKVAEAIYDGLSNIHGVDLRFGRDAFGAMVNGGLNRVHRTEYAESWTGGGGGARFLHSNSYALQDLITASGVDHAELTEYRRIVLDPSFAVKSNLFINTVGHKAAA